MNGPGDAPRRQHDTAAVVSLRVLFCAVALLSCGLLSWVPMLRLALMRLKAVDWVLCGVVSVIAFGALATVGEMPESSVWSDAAVVVLLLLAVGVTAYYLAVDIRHHRERRTRAAQPAPAPYGQPPYGYGHPYAQPHQQPPVPPQPQPHQQPSGPPHQQPYPPVPPHRHPPAYGAPPAQAAYNPYRDTPPPSAHDTPGVPGPHRNPPGTAAPRRMDQVRAELDELSDLLRKEEDER